MRQTDLGEADRKLAVRSQRKRSSHSRQPGNAIRKARQRNGHRDPSAAPGGGERLRGIEHRPPGHAAACFRGLGRRGASHADVHAIARRLLHAKARLDHIPSARRGTPPSESGDFRPADLVELTVLEPTIKLDIRYATTRNFLGTPLYSQPRAFMQRPAAEALVRVHRSLAAEGYGLLVHDAYRP